jgi:hypothetical protein
MTLPVLPARPPSSSLRLHLIALLLAATLVSLWGLQKMLPVVQDVDEYTFVDAALRVAAGGNWNPGFFGHPGSTTIYPLALLARGWHALTQQGTTLAAHYAADWWEYYFLGRLLSVAYHLLTLPLIVLVGRRAFTQNIGLAAAWFYTLYSYVILHAKMVRTDSAGTFFALLALYLTLCVLERPTVARQAAAGAAVGLAVASRYFLAVLGPVLLAAQAIAFRRQAAAERRFWRTFAPAWIAAALAFALSTPYLFLDFETAFANLRSEARTTHLGADGLSPLGNLAWYAAVALPEMIKWPQVIVALAGLIVVLRRPRAGALLVLGYAALFVAAVSLSSLHWHRWLIPVLPVVALLAATGVEAAARAAARLLGKAQWANALFVAGVVAVAIWPASRVAVLDLRHANGNTRLIARAWMLENLPPGSRILQEPYGAPLQGTPLAADEIRALVDGGDLALQREAGYDYVVASSAIYNRFFAEPERYPGEVAFYTALFEGGNLVHEVQPGYFMDGPTIRIYAP